MDYEKKIKTALNDKSVPLEIKAWLEEQFPEFKESDDEKIRNFLISKMKEVGNVWKEYSAKDIIAWLEKQDEHNLPSVNERAWLYLVCDVLTWESGLGQYLDDPRVQKLAKDLCSEYAQKLYNFPISSNSLNIGNNKQQPANKVEPKFHEGDWVVFECGEETRALQIKEIIGKEYVFADGTRLDIVDEDSLHLWAIQDAKDGDVLATDKGVFIYAKTLYSKPYACCGVDKSGVFKDYCLKNNLANSADNIHPATKEQRDLLFQKMYEAGYEWDADKKELKTIEQPKLTKFEEAIKDMMNNYRDAIGDNNATVEEVKKHAAYLLSLIPCKPAEWSEEDEHKIKDIVYFLDTAKKHYASTVELDACIDWLKSLKERVQLQPKQEWSEEDEYCRHQLIVFCENCMIPDSGAKRCAHWLKSLKERVQLQPKQEWNELLEKLRQAVYDCAWEKVTCKLEGETKEEYVNRWTERFLLIVRNWADGYEVKKSDENKIKGK